LLFSICKNYVLILLVSKILSMKKLFIKGLALIFTITLFSLNQAIGQQTLSGKILDSENQPVIGASVMVKGTTVGTITDIDGMYSIIAPAGASELEVSYLGFSTQVLSIADGSYGTIVMAEDLNQLDEVVITGLASSIKRSNLANAVASIGSKELTGITSQSTMDGALYGKLKGAEIRSNSGAPGGGMSVKLRGVTSIFGDQQPLYIIDGIYVDNSSISSGTNIVSAAAGGGNASNQDDASNRVADLVTEDIENIEVLKGASAAAMYGSRAAGGVVLITTKRGKAGESNVQFSQTVGYTAPIRLLGLRESTTTDPGAINYEDELYNNKGLLSTSHLSYSGGTDKTRFYVAGMYKDEEGIVDNTGYNKQSVRLNIDHDLSDRINFNVSSNYINSEADRGFFNNGNTNTTVGYALAFSSPYEDLFPDENGNYPAGGAGSNVLETVALTTNREKVNRFLNGARATVKLMSSDNQSLRAILNAGRDEYTLQTTSLFPQTLSFYRDPSSLGGVSIVGNTLNTINNLSAFLVYDYYTDSGMSFKTQVGVTREHFDQNTVLTTATDLNGAQTNVDQSANVSVFQNRREQLDKGFFAQEEVNLNDQIILTAGIRADKSSNNGDANKLYYYPKASIAVNLSEFDFWSVSALDRFKLRAAYGEAGRFANFNDRFNTLQGTFIGQNAGLETGNLRGNSEVGPERQKELEIGTDFSIMDRVSVEFTFYDKNIEDVLLRANVPTSTGFTTQVVNAAELNNRGIEISLGLLALETESLKWNTQFNFWKNTSEVTKLDVPAFNLGGFAASLGQYRIEEGKSATQLVGTQPDSDEFKVYGDAEADFNLSWINSMEFGKFDLSFVWHMKQGGDGVNLSTLLYDLAGNTWDYDDLTLDPSGELGNGEFRTSEWSAGNAGPWIEDASYLRLREIGLYYTIGRSMLSDVADVKVGISGRNLINIFDYNSYDPEVSNFGGNVLANSIEVTPFPSSKRVNFHVIANF